MEQNFRFAEALGDCVVVMDDGRIVHAGTHGRSGRPTARCSSACSASAWMRINDRRSRTEPSIAAELPRSRADWLPLLLVPALMLAALPCIGNPSRG